MRRVELDAAMYADIARVRAWALDEIEKIRDAEIEQIQEIRAAHRVMSTVSEPVVIKKGKKR